MASWPFMAERCQFHLAQNAVHHAPTTAIRKRPGIGRGRPIARDLERREPRRRRSRVESPRRSLSQQGARPGRLARDRHPRRPRRPHPARTPPQTLGDLEPDRTRRPARAEATHLEVRVFPNNASLLRLVTAVLVEIDETRLASTQPYINWNSPEARAGHRRICRHQVA